MKQALEGWPTLNTFSPRDSSNRFATAATSAISAASKPSKTGRCGRNGLKSKEAFFARFTCASGSAPFDFAAGVSSAAATSSTLALRLRSLSDSTTVSACCKRKAAGTRCATSARKSSRSMNHPASFSVAVTVAVQVPRSMSAISPKTAPPLNFATVSFSPPGSVTVASAAPSRRI